MILLTFNEASELINDGQLLHIAAAEDMLRKLPKGTWVGGSTEYFMAHEGGKVSDEVLFVTNFTAHATGFKSSSYQVHDISGVADDAYDNGFSIVILPFDSAVHKEYAQNAAGFNNMFIKNIAGWVSGTNLNKAWQAPIAVNGMTGEVFTDRAVALHLEIPADKTAVLNIINIFEQDENSPVIEFKEEGFSVRNCFVDGREVVLSEYLAENNISTKLPLVGEYSGAGINISFKCVEDGAVNFYAPVFAGIKYRIARGISDYEQEFNSLLAGYTDLNVVFSCNCILNFLYGGLEGKCIEAFAGPITFGEIAYQLVNQTLVYVTVE
jgi:hypothetical protein